LAKPHARRCRPVAFKEDDREQVASPADQEIREKIRQRDLLIRPPMDTTPLTPVSNYNTLDPFLASSLSHPALSQEAIKVNPLVPAFTRRREVFAGRLAMLGFFAACAWEAFTPYHPGILRQVAWVTGLDTRTIAVAFMGLIAYNTVAAVAPWSPSYSSANLQDVSRRPLGPPFSWVNPLTHTKLFLGIDSWGFTKKNEVFNGRVAMLGFFAALSQEMNLGGVGPLAQIAYYLNITPDEGFYSFAARLLLTFSFFPLTFSLLNGNVGSLEEEEEMY